MSPPDARIPDIGVVVPVHGNAATLNDLHRRLGDVLRTRDLRYEFVFVDDASPDRSREIIEGIRREDASVRLVRFDVNRGQQLATMAGLRETVAGTVVVLDADLQDPPEALPELLDVLNGSRWEGVFAGRRGRYETGFRLVTSRIFKWIVHLLTAVPRDAGSYVVMTRRLVDAVLHLDGRHPYLVGMIGCSGLPVTSVPVTRSARERGGSAYSSRMRLRVGLSALHQILTTWRKT